MEFRFKVGEKVLVKRIENFGDVLRRGVVESVDKDDPETPYLVGITLWFQEDELEKVSE